MPLPKKSRPPRPQVLYDRRRGVYFDKRIGLDTIIGIVSIAFTLGIPILVWGRAMESRVLNLEVTRIEKEKSDAIQSKEKEKNEAAQASIEKEQRAQLLSRLDKLDEKVLQIQLQIGQLVPFGGAATKPR